MLGLLPLVVVVTPLLLVQLALLLLALLLVHMYPDLYFLGLGLDLFI